MGSHLSPFGLYKSYQSIKQKLWGGARCFCADLNQTNPTLRLLQGDEERQLGIPVSPMCELGTPRVPQAATYGLLRPLVCERSQAVFLPLRI